MIIQKLRPYLSLLCKIFLIGLLVQFFLQTFITFQLGRNGAFWSAVRMRKEFILFLFIIAIILALIPKLPEYINIVKKNGGEHSKEGKRLTRNGLRTCFKRYSIPQFLTIFLITTIVFFLIAILIQKMGLSTFILSFKYDLLPFLIFGLGACLAFLFFTEKDKDIFEIYKKLIIISLRWGVCRRVLIYLMPNGLKFFGFDPFTFEGTIGARPPAAYYTLIKPFFPGSHVRNGFLFERPISFGFWLIAFFPLFALTYLRKKTIKKQIGYGFLFWLLVLSTRSRAAIAVIGLEFIALTLIIHRKQLKKYLRIILTLGLIGGAGVFYYGQKIFAREHSNTGHVVLLVEGRKLAQTNLLRGWGAGYSGPASHQLCYTASETIDIFTQLNQISHPDPRCETIRKVNITHQISTYGYNPENQYLQIIMEYGLLGLLFRLTTLCRILYYSIKTIQKYRKTEKSSYQQFLYWSILGFGIGLLGLCIEGMLLHSLVDRMVVYPFFLLYGLTIGLREKVKDVPFIPVLKEKKKKGKVAKKKTSKKKKKKQTPSKKRRKHA